MERRIIALTPREVTRYPTSMDQTPVFCDMDLQSIIGNMIYNRTLVKFSLSSIIHDNHVIHEQDISFPPTCELSHGS